MNVKRSRKERSQVVQWEVIKAWMLTLDFNQYNQAWRFYFTFRVSRKRVISKQMWQLIQPKFVFFVYIRSYIYATKKHD